jgi:hypothetical protein
MKVSKYKISSNATRMARVDSNMAVILGIDVCGHARIFGGSGGAAYKR